jgi:hypothetical protein
MYVILHRDTNTRVGTARTIQGAKLGWDCTPGGDYVIKLEADWKKGR